jgi:5-methylcytosine-specific restriction protein B
MARFSEHDRRPIDGVVSRWREDCLTHDGSLLYLAEQLWTPQTVEELYEHFNLDLQEDPERSFEEKFEAQLEDASQPATRLAAEMVGVYLLFAVNAINGPRKRETGSRSDHGDPIRRS